MANRNSKGKPDPDVQQILNVLAQYLKEHPKADIKVQRQNSVSLRIRIIDPDFHGFDLVDRDTALWKLLDRLPESVLSQITLLLLLTPEEAPDSLANMDFERPIPSRL